MSTRNASPKEENYYTKGTLAKNRGIHAQYVMLLSNSRAYSNGAHENLRGRDKGNDPSLFKKETSNS